MAITELSPYRMCLILTTSQVDTAYNFLLRYCFFSTVDSIGFLDKVRLAIEDI